MRWCEGCRGERRHKGFSIPMAEDRNPKGARRRVRPWGPPFAVRYLGFGLPSAFVSSSFGFRAPGRPFTISLAPPVASFARPPQGFSEYLIQRELAGAVRRFEPPTPASAR